MTFLALAIITASFLPAVQFVEVSYAHHDSGKGKGNSYGHNNGNSAPNANDDSVTTHEDASIIFNVLSNDSDPDGNTLTVAVATEPLHGSVIISTSGSATYTPAADYYGQDSFTYTLSDGQQTDTATVVITINPVNDPPVASSPLVTVEEDGTVTITLPATDIDSNNLTYVIVSLPQHGNLGDDDSDEIVTYTPTAGYVGEDSFTFKANDGSSDSNIAIVSITVTDLSNQVPVAVDDFATTDEDTPTTINVLSNDSDPDNDTILISSISTPTFGTVAADSGAILYTPNLQYLQPGQVFTDTFTYTINDGHENDAATVTVTINGLNDAPAASDGSLITDEDDPASYTLPAIDPDLGDSFIYNIASEPAYGGVILHPDGSIIYTPDLNFVGMDSFSYSVTDGYGASDTGMITVTVNPVNDPPVAVNDAAPTTPPGIAVTIDVLPNDFDIEGDTLVVISVSSPSNGIAIINEEDNTITYTPNPDLVGQDSFDYVISDGNGGLDTGAVLVTVSGGGLIATDDFATTKVNNNVTINVLDNDIGIDEHTQKAIADHPDNGIVTINEDGTITYKPKIGFVGTDVFVYTIYNDEDFDTATVTITVAEE